MKVLQISSNWGHGGPGGVEKDLYYEIIKNNHLGIIAYGRDTVPNEIESIKLGTKLGIYLHFIFGRLFDNEGLNSSVATKELIRYIDKTKPDIIHLHNLTGHYLNYVILFNYFHNINTPIVWTLHDCWAFTGHCINFERVNCDKWKNHCNNCILVHDYPKAFIDRSEKNFSKKKQVFTGIKNMHLVTPSIWLAQLVKKSFLNQYDVTVINNGIDLKSFSYTKSSLKEEYNLVGKTVILFVASVWGEMKGIHIINQLSEIVEEKYKIVVIGNKKGFKLNSNILDIPSTDSILNLAEWYSLADVFVNPTLGDNFPTVNIEALACGTPVVTFKTGGSPEIAGDSCGCVSTEKNANSLYKTILECLDKHISRDDCRNRAIQFSKERMAERYLNLYEQIV